MLGRLRSSLKSMVDTALHPQNTVLARWVPASWPEYVAIADQPGSEAAWCYYDKGWMRIEMAALGPWHGRENSVVSKVVFLFATLKVIRMVELVNTTFRKAGDQEGQPDIAFYLGDGFELPPQSNQPVDIKRYGPPTLVVEIASTTLSDDLGRKRLLYERLGVQEYWVVNVEAGDVIAFSIENGGSREIRHSQVLPGLSLTIVEEAMLRSQHEDDGTIARWLMQTFQTQG